MTGPSKVIIMLVVWLLYALVAYFGCLKDCCTSAVGDPTGDATVTEDSTQVTYQRYPIDFKWSDATAYTNEGFSDFKQSLIAQQTDDNILEITGFYYEGEPAPDGFENMGLARANAIWKTHFSDIPEERIRMRARLVDETEGVRDGYFEAAAFEWNEAEQPVAETVEELDDRIIIRFPFGSVEKEYDPAVDEYLDKLAERVKETGESITLTGHTDNVGEDAANLKLGKERADGIKAILTSKGVDAGLITTSSKGESQPVASNSTEEGRYENRRCEVRLIKNETN